MKKNTEVKLRKSTPDQTIAAVSRHLGLGAAETVEELVDKIEANVTIIGRAEELLRNIIAVFPWKAPVCADFAPQRGIPQLLSEAAQYSGNTMLLQDSEIPGVRGAWLLIVDPNQDQLSDLAGIASWSVWRAVRIEGVLVKFLAINIATMEVSREHE